MIFRKMHKKAAEMREALLPKSGNILIFVCNRRENRPDPSSPSSKRSANECNGRQNTPDLQYSIDFNGADSFASKSSSYARFSPQKGIDNRGMRLFELLVPQKVI